MPPLRAALALLLLALLSAACTKAQAQVEPIPPVELLPPPPPPRVVEQYADATELPAEPTSTEAIVSELPARTVARPPTPRQDVSAKPEPAKAEEPVPPPVTPPAVTLKPTPGSQSTTEASIRDLLGRAAHDLGRVNYSSLTVDGKAQYDTARRFVQQSEDALRNGNLVFAGKLADKAATMAAVLVR